MLTCRWFGVAARRPYGSIVGAGEGGVCDERDDGTLRSAYSVDDHPLRGDRDNHQQRTIWYGAQAATSREAIHQFRQHRPDVTLMDLRLPTSAVLTR